MFNYYREPTVELVSLGAAQALDLLGKVLPIQRQIRSGPGRLTKGAGLLLCPAHEILFVEPCIATGHLFSSQSTLEQRFGAAALPELCGDLDPHAGDFGFELGN